MVSMWRGQVILMKKGDGQGVGFLSGSMRSGMDIKSWKAKAKQLKTEVMALYLASRHPKTPWYAKFLAVLIIGYALSPIDLIPDFIPVLGYLDDLVLIPAGIALLVRIIPGDVLAECRSKARSDSLNRKSRNWVAGAVIVLIWLLILYLVFSLLRTHLG